MKTSIKLILIYFLMQLLGVAIVSPLILLYAHLADAHDVHALPPSLIAGILLMMGYLYKKGYLTGDEALWRAGRPLTYLWTLLAGISFILLDEWLMSMLDFLPDWMEMAFDEMAYSPWGILGICLLGPVLEEMLFRGAVLKSLLSHYRPATAIGLSALLFGIFHVNPAQVVAACCSGLLLGWLYQRTCSLWPSILVHVVNNSCSVFLMRTCPDVEHLSELFPTGGYVLLIGLSACVLLLSLTMLRRLTTPASNLS